MIRSVGPDLRCVHRATSRAALSSCARCRTIPSMAAETTAPRPRLTLLSHSNRSEVPVMTWLHQCTRRQLCRLRMVIWALDAVSADALCCHALLPTRVIAGHGTRVLFHVAPVHRHETCVLFEPGEAVDRLHEIAVGEPRGFQVRNYAPPKQALEGRPAQPRLAVRLAYCSDRFAIFNKTWDIPNGRD